MKIVWASSCQLSGCKFFFKVKYFKNRWQDSLTLSDVFKNDKIIIKTCDPPTNGIDFCVYQPLVFGNKM